MTTTPEQLAFTDRVADFYAREYGFPPVAGRVLGYLFVCRPPQQTIAEIAEALLASRSAITGAVTLLSGHNVVRRFRSAGQRVDHVTLDPRALDPGGFAGEIYREQADLARTALGLLEDGDSERRAMLEEGLAFYEFLAERMPALRAEWHARRKELGHRK
ncbi:MarR family transcriptional regulator [Nonomuraea sp. PA05]|uniref:GbsR/MarR family transcriptional regulator n=1 Tax=Nonomuraea sp. PA05 TaxID=2604466 RepID=UPI0011D5CB30|nr:MarR family transcriptional regulator [Nonomuraea sp. PA05]TYB59501.1 MarR family transcriptional regulator [Nonomuraea sp. PA05]